jgi:TonB-linked SusC/RagA family outer membrane protein
MKLKKLLFFCFSFMLMSITATAQDLSIRGTIVDESGLPLPGVSVLLKATSTGVTTDIDGNYVISASASGVLVFNYVGYSPKEENINGRTLINISLLIDTKNLDEVVVVGYGTQKKSVVTGSISSVKAKDIENLPITRIEQALQGRTSGVMITGNSGQPGSSSTIRVRGTTSFGNNDPLWVIDGVIVDAGGIGFLNQSDIQSIEVLKDAASQAIYGTRAATGVILVTTKKGQEGSLKINYNGFAGFSAPARKLDLLNAEQYATLRNESSVASGGQILFENPASLGKGTDWQDAIFNNSAQRQGHEISLSGGSKKSTYYVSFGLLEQEGIVTTDISKYTRKNLRINSNHKIADWLTFGQSVGFSNEKNQGLGNTNSEYGGPLSSAINLDPITPLVVTDATTASQFPYDQAGIIRDEFGNPYGISQNVQQEITNPLAYIQTRKGNYGWSDNFVGNAFLEIEPVTGLKFRTTLGGKLAYWGSESFTPVYYLNSNTKTVQNNISTSNNRGFGWNIENTLSYTKSLGKHNFNILAGQGTYVDNIAKGTSVTYFNVPYLNFDDAAFPGSHPELDKNSSAYRGVQHRIISVFGRLNYDYNEKYLFTGIIRRDGSSRFGDNNKFGVFPSMSAGWVVTNEEFWKENNIVNTLKIRGGYGTVGSDAIPDFAFVSSVGPGRNYTYGNSPTSVVGYSPNQPSNPDLQWEETSQTNIGFEMRIFNDFTLTVDWYKKVTDNLLRQQRIPDYLGTISDPYVNIGKMENTGFELELGYSKKIGEVNLSVSGNATYLKNEVKQLGLVNFQDSDGFQTLGSILRIQPGHAYNEFYGYSTAGIFQNQAEVDAYTNESGGAIQPNAAPGDFRFVDLNSDGKIDASDRRYIGNPTPDWTYGLSVNIDYKNFNLSILGQGVAGNQIFQGLRRLDIANANYQTAALNRWTGEGTSNSYPRLVDGDPNGNFSKFSDFYLQDGDYFRIKMVQLGFTIPSEVTSKAKIQNLRLYVTGENIFTFTKYTGYDPEIGGGALSIDRGQYPQARSFMFGVNLEF